MGYTKGEWKVISAEFTDKGVAYEVVMPEQEICAANAKLISQAPRSYEWLIKVISQGILSPSHNKELYNEALAIRAEVEK